MIETLEFERAVQKVLDMVDLKDTLVVVTADHSHTLTIGGGAPSRGNNILGKSVCISLGVMVCFGAHSDKGVGTGWA